MSQPGSEGVANFVRQLAARQDGQGRRIGVACPPDSRLATAVAQAGLGTLPWSAERRPGVTLGREVRALGALVDGFDPDIVHLHSSKAGLAGRLALRGLRPTVFQPHAWSFEAISQPFTQLAMLWERRAAAWADAIVTVSSEERAVAVGGGIDPERVEIIPNPVDASVFRPTSTEGETQRLRRSLGLAIQPLVVCLGRLCHQKGQDLLIRAWPKVTATVPGAQLLLVGDGPQRPELERAAGLDVHFLGDRADVPEILRAANVVVMPSRWEGMSLAMLEAMASAKPVVATDVGGVVETVGTGAGAVVPVGDIAGLANETIRRLVDPGLADREGRVGRALMVERHTMDRVVGSMGQVYRRILNAQPTTRPAPASLQAVESADG